MNVQRVGATTSPGIANFSLHKTEQFVIEEYGSKASNFLLDDFYVDDGLTSVATTEEDIELIKESQAMCASAKLRLHNFVSNRRVVLEAVPANDRAKDLKDLDPRYDVLPIQMSLGICPWFSYRSKG